MMTYAGPDQNLQAPSRALREAAMAHGLLLIDPAVRVQPAHPIDPDEPSEAVRAEILKYLGVIGGPVAFEVALRRLDNDLGNLAGQAHDDSA